MGGQFDISVTDMFASNSMAPPQQTSTVQQTTELFPFFECGKQIDLSSLVKVVFIPVYNQFNQASSLEVFVDR